MQYPSYKIGLDRLLTYIMKYSITMYLTILILRHANVRFSTKNGSFPFIAPVVGPLISSRLL